MNVTLPEKEKLNKKYVIIYSIIIVFCIICVFIAFYVQFYARIDLAKLVGINQEERFGQKDEEEIETLKTDFLNVFTNGIDGTDGDYNNKKTDINEDLVSDYLYTKGIPEPDLVIRTSGEMRLSCFLAWQLVYTEFLFIEKLWPDFDEKDLDEAIKIYQNRNRKFGAK